ncbi:MULTISPECIES: entry exclusion protein TrbK [Agrobacterium]|uniref:entry exclusion protein TrbK n=1 Tax=Agrobacterium TaxID=357 RepID=UPI00080FABDB|nr:MULTISPECIES: entry exclusion protein TrbK [Agrobacterium tumefaciens complex]NTJ45271.1 entry exclusion protein TrbK [Agrobacterium larrymoorei]NSL21107.1 entry exclusion protein TrbK [Agrobacterium tumefaciens]NTB05657.1 entry exclusion protein TrbK [Agrobacterium tumefaciens]NTC57430.1 entry exclusion protein TrbK [Agrobacterium tumefaciens]NTC59514.1 entry exclusion protein TrbK [Agrobacterium tumefaciens]
MSPRLIIILVVAVILAAGGTVSWTLIQPQPTSVSGSGAGATGPSSNAQKRQHREQFFGGDTTRDIRGGQEMKPRW